jgi:hypothetical protein
MNILLSLSWRYAYGLASIIGVLLLSPLQLLVDV